MGSLFGTDGVRGLANADLTPELALAVASAAARVLVAHDATAPARSRSSDATRGPAARCSRPRSSPGSPRPVPTCCWSACCRRPAVAFLTASYGADLGVVLSASHNPMPDNGVKLFAAGGLKLPDDIEDEIEAAVDAGAEVAARPAPPSARLRRADDALERYGAHLLGAHPTRLDGLHVVVDCANGAASPSRPSSTAAPAPRSPRSRPTRTA